MSAPRPGRPATPEPKGAPAVRGPESALAAVPRGVDDRAQRETDAGRPLRPGGPVGPRIDDRRVALAAAASRRDFARGLRGCPTVLSWRLRRVIVEGRSDEVALSFNEQAGEAPPAGLDVRELLWSRPRRRSRPCSGRDWTTRTAWALRGSSTISRDRGGVLRWRCSTGPRTGGVARAHGFASAALARKWRGNGESARRRGAE